MAANDPDRDFRRWLRHGEASAIARVFDATADELFALALRLTGSRTDAEDLVQTTFLVALEQSGSYDRRRRVVPWLVGILANHARRLRRERGRSLDVERLHTQDTREPQEELERAELSNSIDRALASVPAKYRTIVEARLIAGERSVDLARRLGRSPGVVRVWFQRGGQRSIEHANNAALIVQNHGLHNELPRYRPGVLQRNAQTRLGPHKHCRRTGGRVAHYRYFGEIREFHEGSRRWRRGSCR